MDCKTQFGMPVRLQSAWCCCNWAMSVIGMLKQGIVFQHPTECCCVGLEHLHACTGAFQRIWGVWRGEEAQRLWQACQIGLPGRRSATQEDAPGAGASRHWRGTPVCRARGRQKGTASPAQSSGKQPSACLLSIVVGSVSCCMSFGRGLLSAAGNNTCAVLQPVTAP